MPTQNTRSQIARKVNFAILLLREAAELVGGVAQGDVHAAPALPASTAMSRALRAGNLRTAGIRAVLFAAQLGYIGPPQARMAGKSMSGSVSKRFVAIGHIVNDTAQHDHLGGGVSYSAVAARRLGYEAHIITKCPPEHRYVADLRQIGVEVHPLPTRRNSITSFYNTCDPSGRRKQHVADVQESISLADFPAFPQEILSDAIVLVAPVIGEVGVDLYPALARSKVLAVTPQGHFRKIDSDGVVLQQNWERSEDVLRHARVTVLSDEDIAITSGKPDEVLEKIVRVCPVVALTLGSRGVFIYQNQTVTHIGAFSLWNDEAHDSTGAGDTFAAVLVTELTRGVEPKAAAVSAALFAALKVAAKGLGIETIPTFDGVLRFAITNQQRVQGFLEQQSVSAVSLFELQTK
jgi:sugar/nucleoside kinase (ribokinase family)